MAKIHIKDLPTDMKISKKELKVIFGGPTRRKDIDHVGLLSTLEADSTYDMDGTSAIKIDS